MLWKREAACWMLLPWLPKCQSVFMHLTYQKKSENLTSYFPSIKAFEIKISCIPNLKDKGPEQLQQGNPAGEEDWEVGSSSWFALISPGALPPSCLLAWPLLLTCGDVLPWPLSPWVLTTTSNYIANNNAKPSLTDGEMGHVLNAPTNQEVSQVWHIAVCLRNCRSK